MSICTLTTRITSTRTIRPTRLPNLTHTSIVTRNWFTVTRTSPTFTIGTAIERRLLLRLEHADFRVLLSALRDSEVKLIQLGGEK